MNLPLAFFITTVACMMTLTTSNPMRRKAKVILDVDPGVDDAHAMLMILSQSSSVQVVALTISQGNTFLSNATHNALRILKLCDNLNIPVFQGDIYTLDDQVKNTSVYFSHNGFGGVPDDTYDYSPYLRQPENAAQALTRLVRNHPNQITLIALGTQTNIARANILDRNFGKHLKRCIIMGGNYLGIGNESPKAEFNFLIDPVAADHVLRYLATDITIITWELCLNHSVEWAWYDSWVSKGTPKANFIKMIGQFGRDRAIRNKEESYVYADQIATAVFIDDSIILESQQIEATVETNNPYNYGEMLVNWASTSRFKNIRLVTRINLQRVKQLLEQSV